MQQNQKTNPAKNLGGLEKLAGDMANQPKRLLTAVLVVGVVITGAIVLVRMNSDGATNDANRIGEALVAAMSKSDATERANAFGDLLGEVKGTVQEPYVLLNAARAEREAGDAAENAADKLKHFEKALVYTTDFSKRYSENLLARLPWRPALQPGTAALPIPARLSEYCSTQIAWLKQHPAGAAEAVDEGFSAAMSLVDPDGKKHALELHFFSAEAPQAVANFVELVNAGYLAGSTFYAQERETAESTAGRGVFFGSAMAKVCPDKPALWGGSFEDVGFTLPKEANRLKAKRGRLMMEKSFDKGGFVGISPVGFLLATADMVRSDDRVVFAEVQGTPEVLVLLEGALVKKEMQEHVDNCAVYVFEKPWIIESVTLTGAAKNKPEVAALRSFKLPTKPEDKAPAK